MLIKLLKNSFKIYKADLSKICRNWVSLVVLGGLVLLPSLYAWINIYASWDPYGNTNGIKISIVNEDKGNVYATIIIPQDFSKKILTLIDREPVKPELEYYVNEKINAIAPKITDKGATTIQNQITTSFIETVADKLIEVMHSVGIEIDKEYPAIEKLENIMIGLQKGMPNIESGLGYLAEKASNGKVVINRQDQNVVKL